MTPKENEPQLNQANCFMYQKAYEDNNEINHCKVRDYCHYADKYRAAVNGSSSLKYKISCDITVFLQTESSYDYRYFEINSTAIRFEDIGVVYDFAVSTPYGCQKSFKKIQNRQNLQRFLSYMKPS